MNGGFQGQFRLKYNLLFIITEVLIFVNFLSNVNTKMYVHFQLKVYHTGIHYSFKKLLIILKELVFRNIYYNT